MLNLPERFFLVLTLCFLSVGVAMARQAVPPGDLLTLDQAITNAVANSRPLKIAALETSKIEDRIAATLTRRRPASTLTFLGAQTLTELNLTFKPGQFGQFPSTGPIPPETTEVGSSRRPVGLAIVAIDQPITQLSKINLSVLAQRLEIDANSEKIRGQRLELISQVRQIYYQILQKETALEASDEVSRHYAELDRITGVAVSQQTAVRSDALEVKALIAQENYSKVTLRNGIDDHKEVLNRLMGRDLRTPFRVQRLAEATPAELDLAAAQARALSQRPEIKQAEIRMKQADYDRQIKKSESRPELSLFFRHIATLNTEMLPRNISAIGFNLSWDPWDWGRNKAELREKDHTKEQANESLIEARNQILAEVSQRFRKLEEARAVFAVIQVQQEAAREKVTVVQEQYTARTVLLKDVLQVQVSLAQINQRYQQALAAFWAAKADFEKSIGTDQ
jgi:outer membrane protein